MLNHYENNILKWAEDRQILQNSTALAQFAKLVSEVGELADNIAKGNCVKDDIGDCFVVLCIIANMKGLTMDECAAQALNDIKDRKGYLSQDGVFVKVVD